MRFSDETAVKVCAHRPPKPRDTSSSMAFSVDVYAWGRHYLEPSSGISDSLHPEQSFDAIGIAHLAVEVRHFDTCGYGWARCVQLIAIQCATLTTCAQIKDKLYHGVMLLFLGLFTGNQIFVPWSN